MNISSGRISISADTARFILYCAAPLFCYTPAMKTCLVIQLRPEDETSDNEFAAILKFGGLKETEVTRLRAEKTGLPSLDLSKYFAIIVGGSPFDISKPEDQKSDIQKKIESDFEELFDQIVPADLPFLGACSGNGLLGRYLGANISNKYSEPVGGVDLTLTEAGKEDLLLRDLPETFRGLVGHKEACDDTPPGAVLLVSSPTCPVQMFRVGENIYATQFHPEADAEGFIVRIHIYKHHGYFPAETAEELIGVIQKESVPYTNEILRRFVKRYRN